jgi:hypothetical protein
MTFDTSLTQAVFITIAHGAPGSTHIHPEIKTLCTVLCSTVSPVNCTLSPYLTRRISYSAVITVNTV